MCLAIIGLAAHPRYSLVIAANRDEYHARPAAPATWWDEGWLAGRDLAGGGTWLGLDRSGRWALLTNVREPGRNDASAPTRGALVTGVLAQSADSREALERLAPTTAHYNGFNLIAGTPVAGYCLSNRTPGVHALAPGLHGISNAALDTPWPKVVATQRTIAAWCAQGDDNPEPLFTALAARTPAADAELPRTGIAPERERLLSAPFIVSPDYGTRCSTVILIGHDLNATFIERSFGPDGRPGAIVDQRFTLRDAS